MGGQAWIGGDLTGLQAMGDSLGAAPSEMKSVVSALSGKVDALVDGAGWKGDAAESFRKAWSTDALTAGALSDAVGQVGSIIKDLAAKLQSIENTLYDASHEAQKQGVPIGPDGKVQPIASNEATTPQSAAMQIAAAQYGQDYAAALQLAKGFRLDAANKLSQVYDQISASGESAPPDQWVTLAGYLRGLYAVPDEKNRKIMEGADTKLQAARDAMKGARKDLKAAKAAYQAKGLHLPTDNPAKLAHGNVVEELNNLRTELASAEAGKGDLPLSHLLNAKLDDIAKEIPTLGKLGGKLGDMLDFAKDVPVLDIAASAAAGALQMPDDIDKGWSAGHAAGADLGSAALGLGAGAATVALASGPVGVVAVGAGMVAVGVGDLAYQAFQENWRQDFAQHGFAGGLADGAGHVVVNTGKDMAHMAEGVGTLAKNFGEDAGHGVADVAKKVWGWL